MCAVVKATATATGRSRPRARRCGAARAGSPSPPREEALELRVARGADPRDGGAHARGAARSLPRQAEVVAWSEEFVAQLGDRPAKVHVKLDTGMGRLGTRELDQALEVAELVEAAPALELVGAMTHFATADEDPEFLAAQLERFEPFVERLRARRPGIVVHAANSAATLTAPREPLRHGPLRDRDLRLRSDESGPGRVGARARARRCAPTSPPSSRRGPGDSVGYGRRFIAERDTKIATLPIGYGDGVPRALSNNCDVLVSRPAPSARRHGQHGQHHDRPRARRRTWRWGRRRRSSAPTATSARRRRTSRGGSARSATRSCAGSRAGCRAPTTATERRSMSATRCDALAGLDRPAWLVGGAVRDRLARTADRRLRRRARRRPRPGRPEPWHAASAGTRSSCPSSSGRGGSSRATARWQLDLLPLAGRTIEDDLAQPRPDDQRDRAAARRRRAGRPVRRPRAICASGRCGWSPHDAFERDPLRVLRLARLASELDFTVEPRTAATAARQRPGAAGRRARAGVRRAQAADRLRRARSPASS